MNAEKLRTYVGWLLADEKQFQVQDALTELNAALANLSASPAEPSYQQSVASAVAKLRQQMHLLEATYDVAQRRGVASIGALRYFSDEMISEIESSISQNAMTPAVVQKQVADALARRQKYLDVLEGTRSNLRALSIAPDELGEDEAEIGFQIPRDIFNNNLDGLVNELRAIRRIIRAFSELATNSVEDIKVNSISTTDPTFYFGLGALTVAQIGYAVQWSLDRWKQVEDIRKVRAETLKIKSFTKAEIEEFFDKKITETVRQEIQQETSNLIGSSTPVGRKAEQANDIAWALESLFARVERGLTVEIRISPPAPAKTEDGTDVSEPAVFDEIRQINRKLSFPSAEATPILSLPIVPEDGRARKTKSPPTPT